MKKTFGWGILGLGRIANRFASDLVTLSEAKIAAVASRSEGKAVAFAKKFGATKYYTDYSSLVADPDVDVVYVATPNTLHREHTLLCLENGKAVLCEKPLAVNERQVLDMVKSAEKNGLFLMEGVWTRCLPVIKHVRKWLNEKLIGEVRMLFADFGFRIMFNPEDRHVNINLAGGALLDVGVYTLALAQMVFGDSPEKIFASSFIGETEVDDQTGLLLRYNGGGLALLSAAIQTNTIQEARIYGTEGSIHIPPIFWRPTSAVLQINNKDPLKISGESSMGYEAAEVMSCIKTGKKESPQMTLKESIATARIMDEARRQIGLIYPMEKKK